GSGPAGCSPVRPGPARPGGPRRSPGTPVSAELVVRAPEVWSGPIAPGSTDTTRPSNWDTSHRPRPGQQSSSCPTPPRARWQRLRFRKPWLFSVSLLRLLEVSQIRSRLGLARGHQQTVRAQHVVLLADFDVIVVLGAVDLAPERPRIWLMPVG